MSTFNRLVLESLGSPLTMLKNFTGTGVDEKKEKKNDAHTWYRHEYEPVIQILNRTDRVVVQGFMPLSTGV